jgi:L-ascorbate metabolism protein UlaG (beta-lactamase superfamily)
LDKDAIFLLTKDDTQLIMNQASVKAFGKGHSVANGDKLQLADGISIETVPAYNITKGHTQFHPKGRDNGYILTIDGLTIYVAGDTEDIDEMANIKDIDIAFLPCNQPYTMTPEQVIKVAKIIRPKVLFPYHYGETDLTSIPTQLSEEGIDVRIRHYE